MEKQTNRFETYQDVSTGFEAIINPLRKFYNQAHAGHLDLGSHGTVYSETTRQAEAFLRPLWGLAPYCVEQESDLLQIYLDELVAATDPDNPNYYGVVTDYDQLLVEMASISTMLLLLKEKTWDRLSEAEQGHLSEWLLQINHHRMPKNNWHFFRILVNIAMKKCGQDYSQELLTADLALIDSFYVGEGWYFDGEESQRDYYVSFALHYYGLLYAHFMEEEDPAGSEKFKERSKQFAQSFKYWFDADGAALPFGRSLTYRFAQAAFWAALVFADVEALPWGEIKGLYSRNMAHWMEQSIFTTDGVLSTGYYYQNLVMAEGYNAPGSPYWACKSFLMLAVPKNHPYWQAEAVPINLPKNSYPSPESRNYYQVNTNRQHLQAFPAGQFVESQNHSGAKYNKLVYSTKFGFSTPKANYYYHEGAFDNCLALSEEGCYYRSKDRSKAFEILDDRIIHQWQPWQDVAIKTTVVPCGSFHVRVHEIDTKRPLIAYEGGFSGPFVDDEQEKIIDGLLASYLTPIGRTSIQGIYGFQQAELVRPEPNTNLLYPRTLLPCLKSELTFGKQLLVSIVGGQVLSDLEERPPKVALEAGGIQINEKIVELGK